MFVLGLDVCTPEDIKLKDKLLRLKLEALVRSGGEKAADEAIKTFSQVIDKCSVFIFTKNCEIFNVVFCKWHLI